MFYQLTMCSSFP